MNRYNPHLRTAMQDPCIGDGYGGGLKRRLVLTAYASRCASGEHRWETDAVTGDEVCRFCTAVMSQPGDLPPVWLLDVDGVVNVTRPGWGAVPRTSTVLIDDRDECLVRWEPELVRQIRQIHDDGAAEVRWCTSWCPWAGLLEREWCLPKLDRSLSVQQCTLTPAGIDAAKAEAALAVVESGRRLIWTDDRAVVIAKGLHDRLTADGRGLLIAPDPRRGLLPAHLDLIEEFAQQPTRRRWPVVLPKDVKT